MSKYFFKKLLAGGVLLVLESCPAFGEELHKNPLLQLEEDGLGQITSVSQLRDVSPADWAFEALRNLVERYGCIVGYPDSTFRGNRPLSRYEFAAGLSTCMQAIERLLAEGSNISQEDVEKINRLAREFQSELGARVDKLEKRVAFLEDKQFSTTTKLRGEVIMTLAAPYNNKASSLPGVKKGATGVNQNQVVFSYRARLNFDASFMGKDLLRVRIQGANFRPFDANSDMVRLSHDTTTGFDNNVNIDDLYYRFPIGDSITAFVGTNAMNIDKVFNVNNPYLESDATGTLVNFLRRNPLVFRGPEGAGGGLKIKLGEQWRLNGIYVARRTSDPSPGRGLFNGAFSTGVQLEFLPSKNLELSAAYLYSYEPTGDVNLTSATGSPIGRNPFGGRPLNAHRVGLQGSWQLADKVNIAAWGGYAFMDNLSPRGTKPALTARDDSEMWTWAALVSFLDVGKEGAVLSLAGGMPPKDSRDRHKAYVVELQYKYPLNQNVLLTPGFYVVVNPNHDSRNDPVWVGAVRTTFRF